MSIEHCIRCLVHIELHKLLWEGEDGEGLYLEGPPIFIRGCVLGQLQHSPLYTPLFPLHMTHQLMFDRVFTNSRNPSVLPELLQGEHVKFELIQINNEHTGGRILAKYDGPAQPFIFPDSPGPLRTITLSKSRKYKNPPQLVLSITTTLTEAMVQSPVTILSQLHRPVPVSHHDTTHDDMERLQDLHQTTKDYSRLTPMTRRSTPQTLHTPQALRPKEPCSYSKNYYVPRNYDRPWMTNSVMKDQSEPVDTSNIIYSLRPPKIVTPKRHAKTPKIVISTEAEDAELLSKKRDILSKPPCAYSAQDSMMMAKYLVDQPGNRRHRTNSYKLIQDKVDQLLRDCRQQKVDPVAIGDDSIIEENDRLRASFAAERQDTMNRTAQYIPDDSLLMKLGPTDYWSRKASQFTGKPHRVIFDEMLEKIYNRLYQQSVARKR